ncbi:MAG: redox-sensing transcriptional repressor Rex [Spirochaetota bacterium]
MLDFKISEGEGRKQIDMDKRKKAFDQQIPEQSLKRIPYYHQILTEMESQGELFVSSRHLSSFFNVDDTQIRKDISVIGYKGKPKYGYSVTGLRQAIGEFLGINYENTAILIGAGKLGSALSEYPGLAEFGVKIVAILDNNPMKIGKLIGGFNVLPVDSLPRVVRSFEIGIAIITVPKEAAQGVVDRVMDLGIKAIWNFAPTQIKVRPDVIIRNENMAVGVAILSHYLKQQQRSGGHKKS